MAPSNRIQRNSNLNKGNVRFIYLEKDLFFYLLNPQLFIMILVVQTKKKNNKLPPFFALNVKKKKKKKWNMIHYEIIFQINDNKTVFPH